MDCHSFIETSSISLRNRPRNMEFQHCKWLRENSIFGDAEPNPYVNGATHMFTLDLRYTPNVEWEKIGNNTSCGSILTVAWSA